MTPFCVFLTQGKIWVRNKESKNELQVTNLNHKYFRQHLEDALSLGRPLLIEDITEELDPALDNILEKNFIKVQESMAGLRPIDTERSFSASLPLSLAVNRPLGEPWTCPNRTKNFSISWVFFFKKCLSPFG